MAEQYSWISANNEGYSAGKFSDVDGNIMPWSRSTVADGKWLNREMLLPFSGRDQYLLVSLNQTYDECSAFSGDLQNQITIIEARSDVIDVVGNHADFEELSAAVEAGTYNISDRDVIKVLNDECEEFEASGCQSYYRYLSATTTEPEHWEYVGKLEPYYNNASLTENAFNLANTDSRRNYTINTDINRFIQMSTAGNTGTIGITDYFISSASQCYTALTSHSASWDETSATLNANSGYWDQAYDWSKSSSADLISVSSTFVEYSGKWNDASATLYNNSANWQATYSAVSSNSAIWNETAYVPLSALECKIGSNNNVSDTAFAQGLSNTAEYTAFAQGSTNTATMNAFSQGTSNTATQDALAQGSSNNAEINAFVQGNKNKATSQSFAQGLENIAISYSFAQGYKNEANASDDGMGTSFAQGYANTADFISFAQGRNNMASDKSFVQGSANTASENGFARGLRNLATGGFANGTDNTANGAGSLAIGANNYAGTYVQALGHGVKMEDSTNTPARGGMAIGAFNKTTANLAFVIGNGLDDSRRSDLYWIDYNGNVFTSGNISAKNFYINGNPIDSIVSAKFSAYNGSTTLLTAYPISSFGLYANTAKYITVATANNNRLDFSIADTLINSASSGYQAKQWINTNGDGIIGSAKSGAAASAWIVANGVGIIGSAKSGAAASAWIVSNGTTFMPKSQTFNAKGNPGNFNQTFNYTGFTLSAGEGVGFYNAGTNSLGISAQAGIPDGTIVYKGITAQSTTGEKNLSKLCITDYVTGSRSYQQLEYSAGATTNTFNLWSTTASTASNLVDATIIPVIDPISNRYKNEYTTLRQLSEALSGGNYVSAAKLNNIQQNITIATAHEVDSFLQENIIYLVY